jgi:hypothetical protein
MFITALFTIPKLMASLGAHLWMMDKEIWYIYTMEFYSAINKNEIMSFLRK